MTIATKFNVGDTAYTVNQTGQVAPFPIRQILIGIEADKLDIAYGNRDSKASRHPTWQKERELHTGEEALTVANQVICETAWQNVKTVMQPDTTAE